MVNENINKDNEKIIIRLYLPRCGILIENTIARKEKINEQIPRNHTS
jgi:hypothetical protein